MGQFAFIEFKLKPEDKAKVIIKKIQGNIGKPFLQLAPSQKQASLI
jgi:hypothetical protein